MCHRQLRFRQYDVCKDIIFVGEMKVDCHRVDCFNSRYHPKPEECQNGRIHDHCSCRRYWTQPERLYKDLPGKCDKCREKDAAAGTSQQAR